MVVRVESGWYGNKERKICRFWYCKVSLFICFGGWCGQFQLFCRRNGFVFFCFVYINIMYNMLDFKWDDDFYQEILNLGMKLGRREEVRNGKF